MNYLDYDIAIELNGVEFTGNPASYILTIRDSIYDVFPQASLFFPDETSIFKTGGMLTDGFPIKLKLGLDGKMVSCPYVISQGETGSNMTVGFISGGMLLKLEHIGVSLMSSRTDAMKGLISDIMDDVIKNLKFDSSSIEKTRGKATWWRLGLNEEDFINKILKPSALSYNGSNTPLFFFGDCRNSFNVKSFSSMIKQKTAASYAVAPQPPSSIRSDGIETVSDIRPFTEGLRSSMMITKPRIFGYNGKNGNMVVNSDSAFKHVEGPGDAIPILSLIHI